MPLFEALFEVQGESELVKSTELSEGRLAMMLEQRSVVASVCSGNRQ